MLIFLVFYIEKNKIFCIFVLSLLLSFNFMNNTYLMRPAKAWLKRRNGPDEIVRVVQDMGSDVKGLSYKLYIAYGNLKNDDLPDDRNPDFLGRILFDTEGYWIYDGEILAVAEQEQLAKFIINYVEPV